MSKKITSAFAVVGDLFFWLIMLICMAASFVVFTSDDRGGSTFRVFGVVQSGSMEASGMYKGDVVYVDGADSYEVGDIILFYRAPYGYGKYAKEVSLQECSIWVHQIVDVDEDGKGRRTYLTKGTSNLHDDGYYVPQDFVLGKAQQLPKVFSDLLSFIGSALGVLLCIVLPSGILFLVFTADFCRMIIAQVDDAEQRKELAAAGRNMVAPTQYKPSKTEKRYRKRMERNGAISPQSTTRQVPQYYWYQYPNYYENAQQTGQSNGYGSNQTNYPQQGYYGYGNQPQAQSFSQMQTTRPKGKKK